MNKEERGKHYCFFLHKKRNSFVGMSKYLHNQFSEKKILFLFQPPRRRELNLINNYFEGKIFPLALFHPMVMKIISFVLIFININNNSFNLFGLVLSNFPQIYA